MLISNNPQPHAQVRPITILVDRFQPFNSRQGVNEVVRLRFAYDAALIERLKALLAVYQVGTDHKTVGGWLPKHGCWFVEPDAWEMVRLELLFLGHRVRERKP